MKSASYVITVAAVIALTGFVVACGNHSQGGPETGPRDYEKTAKWLRNAAEQGNADAQTNLGILYYRGDGVPKDVAEAVKWFKKAAAQGNAGAESCLGVCCLNGDGVPKDVAEAVGWFKKAAEQGNADAQCKLGYIYSSGKDVPMNLEEALALFHKAAKQGLPDAYNGLAWVCATSPDARFRDAKKALEYARKCVDRPDASWESFDTLAAAYARNGQYAEAVQTQEKSLTMLKEARWMPDTRKQKAASGSEKRLELYRNNTAYIDEPGLTAP